MASPFERTLAASIQSERDRQAFLGQRATLSSATAKPEPATPAPPACPSCRDPERLAQLTSCLAEYLGPLAKILVNKAAQSVDSETALIARLMNELERESDRQHFHETARHILHLRD